MDQVTASRVWAKRTSHGEFAFGARQALRRIWGEQQSVQCESERRKRRNVRDWSGEKGPKVSVLARPRVANLYSPIADLVFQSSFLLPQPCHFSILPFL